MKTILFRCLCVGLVISSSYGYAQYKDRIPNGNVVPHPCRPNHFWHGVGHNNSLGGGKRNAFGHDFAAAGYQWTTELCEGDSDNDGQSNGQELGDPNCVWNADSGLLPNRTTDISHPGVCTPWTDAKCEGQNEWVDCEAGDFHCEALNDTDVKNFTLRFPPTSVPAQETTYMCMVFDIPRDDDYHILATTPNIDNENVMHHIIIYGCIFEEEVPPEPYVCGMGAGRSCFIMMGGWTVGMTGYCLHDDVGFKFGNDSRVKSIAMEYHWNNPDKVTGWTDSSGVTFYYTPTLRPYNAGMLQVGQAYLEIPPRETATKFEGLCSSKCSSITFQEPIYVTNAINHMHYQGASQKIEQFRNGSKIRDITNEPSYSYDNPYFYEFEESIEVLPGDELLTTCVFDSSYSDRWAYYGDATSDEMCFGFLIFYPTEAAPRPQCQGWKTLDTCHDPLYTREGCYFGAFGSSEAAYISYIEIMRDCNVIGRCRPECRETIMKHRAETPCLQGGDITDFLFEFYYKHTVEGLKFILAYRSCDVTTEVTEPPTVPTSTEGNVNSVQQLHNSMTSLALLVSLLCYVLI